jgi:outer membrane murein-binding lipoprotein Lpp
MTIKSHLPWTVKVLFAAVGVIAACAIAYFVFNLEQSAGSIRPGASERRIRALTEQVKQLTDERDSFSSTVNAAQSQLNIQVAAQNQMASQVKTLEAENAKLKEDLGFFESLLPTNIGVQGITIQRLQAELAGPGRLRYRLLAMQGQSQGGVHEFVGNLQLLVTVQQQGQTKVISFPGAGNTDAARFRLSFKYYQRVEGELTLPEGATIKSLQARVLEKGQLRAQQTANL